MKQEIAQKWIAALRSGEYKQGKNVLYDARDNSYCCLGVLCKTIGKQFVKHPTRTLLAATKPVPYPALEKRAVWVVEGTAEGQVLPYVIQEEVGMHSTNGMLPQHAEKITERVNGEQTYQPEDDVFELTSMNDGGKTFAEIADVIERNWNDL